MRISLFAKIIIFTSTLSYTAHARLGETIDQCEARYGTPLFANTKNDLSYGMYDFSSKKVRVLFFKGKSILEMFIFDSKDIYSKEQRAEFGSTSLKFIRGILMQAYDYDEEKLSGLTNLKMISRQKIGASVENESTRVSYSIEANEEENSAKTVFTIGDSNASKLGKGDEFTDFMGESVTKEHNQNEIKSATGF